jgi:MFS family permease
MWKRALVLGTGYFALNVISLSYNAFMPLLYRNFVSNLALVGLLMTIDNIMAVTLQPWWGARSDRTHTRLGRRLPYILMCMPLAALFFAVIPFAAQATFGLLLGSAILLNLAISVFRAPLQALLSDVFPANFRSQASGIATLVGAVGSFAALFGGGLLFRMNMVYPFIAAAGCLLITTLVIGSGIKEPAHPNLPSTQEEPDLPPSIFAALRTLFSLSEKSPLLFLMGAFCIFIAYTGHITWWTTFAKDALGLAGGDAAVLLSRNALGFLIGAIPAGLAGRYLGRKRTILAGILVLVLAYFALLAAHSNLLLIMLQLSAGLGWALILVNTIVLAQSFAGPRQAGLFTGIYILSSEAAQIVGPPITGWMMQTFGPYALWVTCAVALGFGAVLISRVREGRVRVGEQTLTMAVPKAA